MQFHPTYARRLGLSSPDEVFEYLKKTFNTSRVTAPSYFVNWDKVDENTAKIEMCLHQLDYVLGKPDMRKALFDVLKENPKVVEALPIVFAARESGFILVSDATGPMQVSFRASDLRTDDDLLKVVAFCEEIGLLAFLQRAGITSFNDYVYGVEVGIDTNGRKNRGGKQMEETVEKYLSEICKKCGYRYLVQASASQIEREFGRKLQVDKTNRRIDFAVCTPRKLFLIETNYYQGTGSKLKATAGEYKTLYDIVESSGHQFIWVTDGNGWLTTLNSLRETFDHTDHILNLEMLEKGVLEDLLAS